MIAIVYLLKIILFPIILLLSFIIRLRNWLFDTNIFTSIQPRVFTINVGNLTVGGTGKTPHIEYLIHLLSNSYQLSVLSRGYGRTTKGFLEASQHSTPDSIGDEPFQIYKKFSNIRIFVEENRVKGSTKIQELYPTNELLLLDDAFQHRPIQPHFNILLSDFNRPFYADSLLPFGRLRDTRISAKRADCVIVTKCPISINEQEQTKIIDEIRAYTQPTTPVFFSQIKYQSVRNYGEPRQLIDKKNVVIIEAIANASLMIEELKKQSFTIKHIYHFRDHHRFTAEQIQEIITQNPDSQFVTTEKDFVKINGLLTEAQRKNFFYVPIEVELANENAFTELILRRIKEYERKNSAEKA